MKMSPPTRHSPSTHAFRSRPPHNGGARKVFCELADHLLLTAHATAEACFAPWSQTTFAERAVVAAQSAANLRTRAVTIWNVAEQPDSHAPSGYERIRARLSLRA